MAPQNAKVTMLPAQRRLAISFSGGETSAYMTQWALQAWRNKYDKIVVVFANTGQENEETLVFVKQCSEFFGFETAWVEAVTSHGIRKSSSHKVVTFDTASRDGQPFEQTIRKYGIPNMLSPKCSDALKRYPIESYLRSIGWQQGKYDHAIGIRADEHERAAETSARNNGRRLVYPLVKEHPMTKLKINAYWAAMPFRLRLKGYEGNCKWCWKKTLRKHLTIISEHPERYEFPARMEKLHGMAGPMAAKTGEPQRFFRNKLSVADLLAMAAKGGFEPYHDDAQVYDDELDMTAGCTDSCEAY